MGPPGEAEGPWLVPEEHQHQHQHQGRRLCPLPSHAPAGSGAEPAAAVGPHPCWRPGGPAAREEKRSELGPVLFGGQHRPAQVRGLEREVPTLSVGSCPQTAVWVWPLPGSEMQFKYPFLLGLLSGLQALLCEAQLLPVSLDPQR